MSDERLSTRRVRVCYFNTWAGQLEPAADYVARARSIDLTRRVSDPSDPTLMEKARLDCDWHAEITRCFAQLRHDTQEFLPAWVTGVSGLVDLPAASREPGEERWLITTGHEPQSASRQPGKVFDLLRRMGIRHLFYGYDEASRCMPCFAEIAPHLDVLIHDELPLDPVGRSLLRPGCRTVHRGWLSNTIPFDVLFNETPEQRIVFVGSEIGLTPHRRRQIEYLQARFKHRFTAICDHSLPVAARSRLADFKVGFCPEGRKFTTPAMAKTHTDRPFWSGCLGLVPVCEDSATGGRLEALHAAGLIVRYAHGDLQALGRACEQALAAPDELRRRIYDHFNRHETIGTVVADAIAASPAACWP